MYFGVEHINDLYELPDANMDDYKAKECEPNSWMAKKLCTGKDVSWAVTKRGVSMNDFTVEA